MSSPCAQIKYQLLSDTCTIKIHCGTWWRIGRVEAFDRRVVGSNLALAATLGPWPSPSLKVACGASAWSSGTLSVLCREHFCVVADLNRRYKNGLNEWMNENNGHVIIVMTLYETTGHLSAIWEHRISYMERGVSLVNSSPFVRRVAGSNPALAPTYGLWASPSLTVACGASL